MEDFKTEDKATLDSLSISELKLRHGLLAKVIKEAQADGDSRWEEAARQQRVVNEALTRKIKEDRHKRGIPEPEPVRVGMRVARMKGRALTGGK